MRMHVLHFLEKYIVHKKFLSISKIFSWAEIMLMYSKKFSDLFSNDNENENRF